MVYGISTTFIAGAVFVFVMWFLWRWYVEYRKVKKLRKIDSILNEQ